MSKKKIISLCLFGLMVLVSYASWQNLNDFLNMGEASGNEAVLIALAFLFLSVFWGLAVLLFDAGLAMAGLAAALGIFLLIFGAKIAYVLAAVLGLIFIFLAVLQSLSAKRVHLRILSWEILKPALGFFFTVVAALIGLVLYFSPTAHDLSVEIQIPRPLFSFIYKPVSLFVADQIKNNLISNPSGAKPGGPGEQVASGALEPQLNQQAEDRIYELANQQINYFLRTYKRFLPYGFAVATFVALKTVSLVVVWIALGLIQLIFALMKSAGLVVIKRETVEKEIIQI